MASQTILHKWRKKEKNIKDLKVFKYLQNIKETFQLKTNI